MFKKFASLALVATLICTLCGHAAFAQNKLSPDIMSNRGIVAPDFNSVEKKEAQTSTSLKADLGKLVAEARAGKGLSVSDPQNQPVQSNSLSKTAKIGIVVGIAVVVILVIIVFHEKNHFFDDAQIFR
jgi:ABC-type enterobactin transport system permease subunit